MTDRNPRYRIAPDTDLSVRVAFGLVDGMSFGTIQGQNSDVDTATVPEDLWEGGGLYPFPATAQSIEILSDSASDAAAGTGARTVTITGLDSNYVEQSQTVTLNGVSAVDVPLTWLRINSTQVATCGSGGFNVGMITTRIASAGNALSHIMPTVGRAKCGVYTVPLGKSALIKYGQVSFHRTATSGSSCEISVLSRTQGGPWILRQDFAILSAGSSAIEFTPLVGVLLTQKSDTRITCTSVSDNNTTVQGVFSYYLRTN